MLQILVSAEALAGGESEPQVMGRGPLVCTLLLLRSVLFVPPGVDDLLIAAAAFDQAHAAIEAFE